MFAGHRHSKFFGICVYILKHLKNAKCKHTQWAFIFYVFCGLFFCKNYRKIFSSDFYKKKNGGKAPHVNIHFGLACIEH